MGCTMWNEVLAIVGPILTFFGVLLAPELGRRAGKKQVEAVLLTADAKMTEAVAAEREAATADWAQFTEAMQKWNESLASRLLELEKRLSDAEVRSAASELRAATAERLYAVAVAYLRRVVRWLEDNWPGENFPKPPPELEPDLLGH